MSNQRHGVTDLPIRWDREEEDLLNISRYLQGLKRYVRNCPTPLSIAVQGDWGTGKTSVLSYLMQELGKDPDVQTVYFNTWQYSQFDMGRNLYFSFLSTLSQAISDPSLKDLGKRLVRFAAGAGKLFVGAATNIDMDQVDEVVDSVFKRQSESVEEISAFHDGFAQAVRTSLERRKKERLVIFVDDLDRLEPHVAISLLEVLKLFTDVEQCVFVMSIDYEVVVQGVRQKYSGDIPLSKCRSFFDKIIQLSFRMPVEHYDLAGLIRTYLSGVVADVFYPTVTSFTAQTIGKNPRAFKRMLNSFLLICSIYEQEGTLREEERAALFCCLCIQNSSEETYGLLLSDYFWGENGEPLLCGSNLSSEDIEQQMKELYPQEGRIDPDMVVRAKAILTAFPNMAEGLYGDRKKGMQSLRDLLQKSSITAVHATPEAAAGAKKSSKVSRIILEGIGAEVPSTSEALFRTYAYFLSKADVGYSPDELIEKLPVLCRKGERDNGFFRIFREISYGGEALWLGLSSSSDVKKRQVQQLCRLLGLAEDAVMWFEGAEQVFPAP